MTNFRQELRFNIGNVKIENIIVDGNTSIVSGCDDCTYCPKISYDPEVGDYVDDRGSPVSYPYATWECSPN